MPFMAVLYVAVCLILLIGTCGHPRALAEEFAGPSGSKRRRRGLGAMMWLCKRVLPGIFSNESGRGSAPIAARRPKPTSRRARAL